MLLDVRSYLKERRQASLADLAIRFRSQPDAMRGMLGHWIAKGQVRRVACAATCGKGCGGCSAASPPELYEWLERPAAGGPPGPTAG